MIDFQLLEKSLESCPQFEVPAGVCSDRITPPEHAQEPTDTNPFLGDDSEYVPTNGEAKVFNLPEIQDAVAFSKQELPALPILIDGLLHQGTKCIVGGGSKSYKTWMQIHIGACVAYGIPWMGHNCNRNRVLFVNFEIHQVFFQNRLLRVLECMGINQEPGWLDVWNLRGYAAPYGLVIPKILERIKTQGYGLIILDPIYKLYGSANENDASEVAQLLNSLETVCVESGAAVLFGAHYSKGNQSQKEAIDRVSGSGVFARDPDTILPFTAHEADNSFTIEPILRNLPPIDPFVVTWQYPMFQRNDDLDPMKLKVIGGRTPERPDQELLAAIRDRTASDPISVSDWADLLGMKRPTLSERVSRLRDQGFVGTAGSGTTARKFITEKGLKLLGL